MSKKNRSFHYGTLLPALPLSSVIPAVQALSAGSAKPMNWANPVGIP